MGKGVASQRVTFRSVVALGVGCVLTCGVGTGSAIAAHRHSSEYTVPASIDATGASDVTPRLQRFFNRVPNGSTILFPAHGRYRIEGTLVLTHRKHLTIDGQGAEVFATTTGDARRSQFQLTGDSNMIIKNLRIRGANPHAGQGDDAYRGGLHAQHGVDVEGDDNVVLDHLTITDTYGDFVYVGKNSKGHWSNGVLIENSTFTRNGRQGVSITAGRNVSIINNSISQTRMVDIDLEPNGPGWGVDRVLVAGNHIGPGRLLFIAGQGNGPLTNVTVRDNVLSGHPMNLDIFDRPGVRRGFTVTGNTSDTPFGSRSGAVIVFHGVNDIDVTGNRQPLKKNRNMVGVRTTNACGIHIDRNYFPGGTGQRRVEKADCSNFTPRETAAPRTVEVKQPSTTQPKKHAHKGSHGGTTPQGSPGGRSGKSAQNSAGHRTETQGRPGRTSPSRSAAGPRAGHAGQPQARHSHGRSGHGSPATAVGPRRSQARPHPGGTPARTGQRDRHGKGARRNRVTVVGDAGGSVPRMPVELLAGLVLAVVMASWAREFAASRRRVGD